MPPDLIGGRYRVQRVIGQGGMGTVWLCHDELLRRDVAVKQVGKLPGESATDSARALREARSTAALDHRNVVTVFDVVEEPQAIWLVMENVPSQSLSELVARRGPLEAGLVADIGAQVADGLSAAHAAGIMHRDVKPGNVLVREDGVAKVSDFGIARLDGDPVLTHSGLLTGTPAYFSPQLARGEAPTPLDDVWALGATLYAAVEGRPPYRLQRNPVAVLDDIARHRPPAPRLAGPLEPVLQRMLERDPAARWSMADAAHVLHRVAAEHAPRADTLVSTRPQQAVTGDERPVDDARQPRDERARRSAAPADRDAAPSPRQSTRPRQGVGQPAARPRRGRGPLVLAGLLAVLVLAGAGYLVLHDTSSPTASPGGSASRSASAHPSSATPRSGRSSPGSGASAHTPQAASGAGSSEDASGSAGPSLSGTSGPSATTSGATGAALASTSTATFLSAYFAAAPGGTDAAWERLGPGEQAQGRARYDGFWRGISAVTVSDVASVPGEDAVDATVHYLTTDGGSSREHKRFFLVRAPQGGWLIDHEESLR